MSRIRHIGNRHFEKMLKEAAGGAFNGPQGRILYVLWENDDLTITQIGRLTSLANTTLTSMLDRMEAQGLVERKRDPGNRRRILVKTTPKAEALRGEYERVSDAINEVYFDGFTEEEIRRFEGDLRRILANFEKSE